VFTLLVCGLALPTASAKTPPDVFYPPGAFSESGPGLINVKTRYGASGLNLVCAILLWNTVYLERAVQAIRDSGKDVDGTLLPHLSPLGWEQISLTGDYIWQQSGQVEQGHFRPLRMLEDA